MDAPLRPCVRQCNRGGSNEGQRAQHDGVEGFPKGMANATMGNIKFLGGPELEPGKVDVQPLFRLRGGGAEIERLLTGGRPGKSITMQELGRRRDTSPFAAA